jgi:signal peptidase I
MSFLYFYLLILVHPYLAMWWKSFPKAGRKAWEALIPGYNYFIVFKITCSKPFWALLMLFPGVHLVMLAVANASYLKRFGYYSFTDTLQAIFFPYLLSYKATKENAVFGKETNWSNSKEIQSRKWSDHIALFMSLPIIGHVIALAIGAVSRDKPGNKSRIKEWGDSIIFALVAASIIRTYVFEPFQIPTGSMEKTLLVGDFLFVNKLAYGPKVPVTPLSYPLVHNNVPWINIPSYTLLEKGSYFRLPGFGKVNRNDVVVFNYPSGDTAIYDPRVPEGLMGHDYHGVLISEALYYWGINKNAPKPYEPAYENFLNKNGQDFITNINYWKKVARQGMVNGETYCRGGMPEKELEYIQHKGLIYRPVDKRENYIKRCVGTPGDWLEVKKSVLYVNGKPAWVAPNQCLQYKVMKSNLVFPMQNEMSERFGLENDPSGARIDFEDRRPDFYILTLTPEEKKKIQKAYPQAVFEIYIEKDRPDKFGAKPTVQQMIENLNIFPKDFYINNTMTDFDKFQVPSKGQTIAISKNNIAWYRRIITAYEGHTLEEKKDGSIYIDGKKVSTYTFGMNYYWLMGDNRYNSADSRVWGFVPEDHVVGRASLVWFSKSAYKGIRWDRLFKLIK